MRTGERRVMSLNSRQVLKLSRNPFLFTFFNARVAGERLERKGRFFRTRGKKMKNCRLCGEKYIKHFILHSIYLMLCNMMPIVAFLNFFLLARSVKHSSKSPKIWQLTVQPWLAWRWWLKCWEIGNYPRTFYISISQHFAGTLEKTGRRMDKFIMYERNVEWERVMKKTGECESSKGRETITSESRSFAISSENFNHPLEAENATMQSNQTKPSHKSVDVKKLINKNNNKWRCITHNFSISHHTFPLVQWIYGI